MVPLLTPRVSVVSVPGQQWLGGIAQLKGMLQWEMMLWDVAAEFLRGRGQNGAEVWGMVRLWWGLVAEATTAEKACEFLAAPLASPSETNFLSSPLGTVVLAQPQWAGPLCRHVVTHRTGEGGTISTSACPGSLLETQQSAKQNQTVSISCCLQGWSHASTALVSCRRTTARGRERLLVPGASPCCGDLAPGSTGKRFPMSQLCWQQEMLLAAPRCR